MIPFLCWTRGFGIRMVLVLSIHLHFVNSASASQVGLCLETVVPSTLSRGQLVVHDGMAWSSVRGLNCIAYSSRYQTGTASDASPMMIVGP